MAALDPVTLQILKSHFEAAAESMAFTLLRTAHSAFVKETEDFTSGLTTPCGQTFASPKDLGATWFIGLDYKGAIDAIADYKPGDICITNDPYSGYVCTHAPDIHLWMPVFHEDRLVCFAVGHIHNTDMGGAVPASLSRALTEVQQEGIRIPPMKLVEAGVMNDSVLRIMLRNVRDKDFDLFADLARDRGQQVARDTVDLRILVPAFMISEIRRGFEIGFLIVLPFLVIDLIVATVTMAMGMMMLPPTVVSLPFKIMFFVLIDGWNLLVGSLVRSFH